MDKSVINITTFNCRGIIGCTTYVDVLLKSCDILCLQEHHLVESNKSFIESIDNNFESFTRCDSEITHNGSSVRKGGITILWRRNMNHVIMPMHSLGNNRIQVVKIESVSMRPVYIINVYLPSANNGYDDFENTFNELIDVYQLCAQTGETLILGDLNVTIGMGPRSTHHGSSDHRRSHYVEEFLRTTNQISVVTLDICGGPEVTYLPYSGSPGTQIDHIIVSNTTLGNITEVYVCDDNATNTSDHLPVCMQWQYQFSRVQLGSRQQYRWDKADKNLYRYTLDTFVSESNLCDTSLSTAMDIDTYCDHLTVLMRQASDRAVPKSKFSPHRKPYWTDELKGLHNIQRRLRLAWIREGRPRGGSVPFLCQLQEFKARICQNTRENCVRFRTTDVS